MTVGAGPGPENWQSVGSRRQEGMVYMYMYVLCKEVWLTDNVITCTCT